MEIFSNIHWNQRILEELLVKLEKKAEVSIKLEKLAYELENAKKS